MGRILGGGLLILLSLFMLLGYLQADLPAGAAARIVFFICVVLAPASGGVLLIRSWFTRRRKVQERKELLRLRALQMEILKLVGANGGSLRAIDAAAELGIPRELAERTLERFAVEGAADVEISESGELVYRFDESQIPRTKRTVGNAEGM